MIKNIFVVTIIVLGVIRIYPQDKLFDPQLEIQRWQYGQKSAFSFTFDDGLLSQYEYARPILEQYDFRGTFYVLPPFLTENLPGLWRYGTWPMFQSMSWDNHEIGSHTLNHLYLTSLSAGDTLTQNTIHYELYHSQKQIELRTEKPCLSIAYPFSDHDSVVDSLTSIYYLSGRSVDPLPNDDRSVNWFDLASYPVTFSLPRNSPADDLDELNSFMEWTENSIADSSWGIMMVHEVVPFVQIADLIIQGLYEPISTEWFSQFCEWLETQYYDAEVWVETVENVTKYSKERDNSEYEIVAVSEVQMEFRLHHNLETSIFNYPLTVLASVPDDWLFAYFSQGEISDSMQVFESHLGNTIMCYVVPDGSIFTISKNPLTDIAEIDPTLSSFELKQNYPNPFNPSTKIKYTIPSTEKVSLKIYDILGNEVATLVNQVQNAGTYEIEFSAYGGNYDKLPSGVYFYRLQSGNFIESKKMILIK